MQAERITALGAVSSTGTPIDKCHTRWSQRDAIAQLPHGASAIAALLTPLPPCGTARGAVTSLLTDIQDQELG